jgi:hypothetical protein
MNPKFMNIQSAVYATTLSTFATAPHAATTDALVSMAGLWVLSLGEAKKMVKLQPMVQDGTISRAATRCTTVAISSNQWSSTRLTVESINHTSQVGVRLLI